MMMRYLTLSIFVVAAACSRAEPPTSEPADESPSFDFQYLALGDSYTIGQSVCSSCSFPQQLVDSIRQQTQQQGILAAVAQTGWTTSRLLSELDQAAATSDYDLVSLLIGVNNQFLELPFETFENELPLLVGKAIELAQGDPSNVILLSIPDYRFTPFGQTLPDPEQVSMEIDQYNAYGQKVASQMGVSFLNITALSRNGLNDPTLVASDGLHLSQLAYQKVVERMYPKAIQIIGD